MNDYCSCFPEYIFGVYIGDCCAEHDDTCSTRQFFECLNSKINIIIALLITAGGAIGCWVKYTNKMWRRI